MIPVSSKLTGITSEVIAERHRQERLKAQGKFRWTCSDREMTEEGRLAVLAEEFGEAAHEVTELLSMRGRGIYCGDVYRNLRTELIQIAAVAVAWVEGLDKV